MAEEVDCKPLVINTEDNNNEIVNSICAFAIAHRNVTCDPLVNSVNLYEQQSSEKAASVSTPCHSYNVKNEVVTEPDPPVITESATTTKNGFCIKDDPICSNTGVADRLRYLLSNLCEPYRTGNENESQDEDDKTFYSMVPGFVESVLEAYDRGVRVSDDKINLVLGVEG